MPRNGTTGKTPMIRQQLLARVQQNVGRMETSRLVLSGVEKSGQGSVADLHCRKVGV